MEIVTLVGISGVVGSLSMIPRVEGYYGRLACVTSALWALLWTVSVTLG